MYMSKIRTIRRLLVDDELEPLPDAGVLLDDLRIFCHAEASTHCFDDMGRSDPMASAQLEGRRQVWLRIQAYLLTDEKELAAIGRNMHLGDDEDE
jgi:hypothetical protein